MSEPIELLTDNAAHLTLWTAQLRAEFERLLAQSSPRVVKDFLDSLPISKGIRSVDEQAINYIVAHCTPQDISFTWKASQRWADTVEAADLSDVLAGANYWTEELRVQAMFWLLENASPLELRHLRDTVPRSGALIDNHGPGGINPHALVRQLAMRYTPHEVANTWRQIHVTVGVPATGLSDVLGGASAWTSKLTLAAVQWLREHAARRDVWALFRAKALSELPSDGLTPEGVDAEVLLANVSVGLSPHELGRVWRELSKCDQPAQPHRTAVNAAQRDGLLRLETLVQLPDGRRWHTPSGRATREQLAQLRQAGTPVARLAKAVGVTPTRVYQLTRTDHFRGADESDESRQGHNR